MEKLKNGFLAKGYFSMVDEGEIDTKSFFKDSIELAKFTDKIIDKRDDHPSTYCEGNIYRYFRNFKRVNRSKQGRGADEFTNNLKYEGVNCFMHSGNGCFLNCNNYFFKKDFSMEYFKIIQSS